MNLMFVGQLTGFLKYYNLVFSVKFSFVQSILTERL